MLFLATSFTGLGNIMKLIGLIILCIIIIAASYYTTKFIGQKQMGNVGESNFKSIDVYRINQNKYIQILKVANKYLVIAVCKDTVTLLGELEESEITFKNRDKKRTFKDILDKVSAEKADTMLENPDESENLEEFCETEENPDLEKFSAEDSVEKACDTEDKADLTDGEQLLNGECISDCETEAKTE